MIVIRSFDVNKPGEEVKDLRGGVAGGSILQGVLKVGDEIEIRPGIVSRLPDGSVKCVPLFSRIKSLYAEHNDLQFAVPGGLIGVGTLLDPTLTRADRLVGQVLGAVGHLPEIYTELEVNYYLLRRLLGVKTADGEKQGKVQKLAKGETLMVNIGSTSTGGRIGAVKVRGGGGEPRGRPVPLPVGAAPASRANPALPPGVPRAGGPGKGAAHVARVHRDRREDRAQPPNRQALAADRLGRDPEGRND